MRRFLEISCIILMLLITAACSSDMFPAFLKQYNEKGYVEEFAQAIASQDTTSIKSFFAPNIVAEVIEIDEQIKNMCEFINNSQGQLELRGGPGSTGEVKFGTVIYKTVTAWYSYTAEDDMYLLIFLGMLADEGEPDNIGIHSLCVIKVKDEDKADDRLHWLFAWKEVEAVKGIQILSDYKYHY